MTITERIKNFFASSTKSLFGILSSGSFDTKDYTKQNGLTLNELSLYLNKAIGKRSDKVGQTEFTLMRGETPVKDHWVLDLLQKPNKLFTGFQFWRLYQQYKDLCGKVYILKVSNRELFSTEAKVTELHLLMPLNVKENFDETKNEIVSYTLRRNDGSEVTYEANQIIRSINPNPRAPLQGMSIIQAGLKAISTEIQLEDYQANILKNGGKLQSMFKFKTEGGLTEEQLLRLKTKYKEEFSEAQRAGLPVFVGGDADLINLGLNPEELGYLASKNVNLGDICIMTGVPKSVLGTFDEIKYNNAEEGNRAFLQETIKPLLDDLVTHLDWFLVPEGYDLGYVDPTPENKDEKRKDLETANTINAMTINEKRERIGGLDPIEGGDEILVPFSLMPLSQVNEPTPSAPAPAKESKGCNHEKGLKPLIRQEIKEGYINVSLKRIDRKTKKLKTAILNEAVQQEGRVIAKIPASMKELKLDINDLFDMDDEVMRSIKFIMPFLEEFIKESGQGALDVTKPENEFELTERIKKILQKRAEYFAKTTNETTYAKLKDTLAVGISENEGITELTDRVKQVFKEYPDFRAEMVARTEANAAHNEGLLEGFKQSDIAEYKEWIDVGAAACDECNSIGGEIVKLSDNFSNGLAYPPAHPNCRCVIGPAFEE